MSGMEENEEEARKMVTSYSAKARRVRLVIGLSFTGAKLGARTKTPVNKGRGLSPKQG